MAEVEREASPVVDETEVAPSGTFKTSRPSSGGFSTYVGLNNTTFLRDWHRGRQRVFGSSYN